MSSFFEDYTTIAKSGLFDAAYYLCANPDVAELNYDPLLHYLEQGARELRNPNPDFDAQSYVSQCRVLGQNPDNPLLHYIRISAAQQQQQATMPDAEADCLLSLDRAVLERGPDGARSVTGEGWVVARARITEIAAVIGQTGAVARYGISRADVAEAFPGYPRSAQSGFAFTLTGLGPEETDGSVDIVFTVRTADGMTHRHAVQTYLPPMEETEPAPAPSK